MYPKPSAVSNDLERFFRDVGTRLRNSARALRIRDPEDTYVKSLPRPRALSDDIAEAMMLLFALQDDPEGLLRWLDCGRRLSQGARCPTSSSPALEAVHGAPEHGVIYIGDRRGKPKK